MSQKWYQKDGVQASLVGGVTLILATAIATAIPNWLKIPKYETEIENLRSNLSDRELEVLKLETQLTPYRTLAVEIFGGSESEALSKLLIRFSELDSKVTELKQIENNRVRASQSMESLKQTPPVVNSSLHKRDSGEWIVSIVIENDVPIKVRWSVSSEENKVVSPIMLGFETIYPKEGKNIFNYRTKIHEDSVTNGYVELWFSWSSIYFTEQGRPDNLKGEIIKAYKYDNGKLEETKNNS